MPFLCGTARRHRQWQGIASLWFHLSSRICLHCLKDTTVSIFAEDCGKAYIKLNLNGVIDEYTISDLIEGEYVANEYGTYFEDEHITGNLVVSMPRPDFKPPPLSKADQQCLTCEDSHSICK